MIRTILLILSFILIAIGFGPFVQAQESTTQITAENAYAFATAPTARTGAIFMTLKNNGALEDALTGAQSDVAEINEIHENIIDPDDGKMMMRKITDIALPPYGSAVLEPKGKHIMLIKLKEGLVEGSTFNVTLEFAKESPLMVPVKVIAPGADAPDHNAHGGMDHGSMGHEGMSHEGH